MSEQMIGGCENYTFAFLGGGEQNLTLERKVCVEKFLFETYGWKQRCSER